MSVGVERDLEALRLLRWGRVGSGEGVVPWVVFDPVGVPVEPVRRFLADLVARGNSPASVRSYAYALLRWWRWLVAVGVEWDRATSAEVRDLVLWLMQATKSHSSPRSGSNSTAGTVNSITRRSYLTDRYAARTVRHSNAVVRSFYAFWIERSEGLLVNPVELVQRGRRPHAHHDPLEPFRPEGKVRYNPTVAKRRPRAIPDDRWRELFGVLRSNRDRALLACVVSNGARAGEILGVRGADVDWGDQLIRVFRKGTRAEQWLPASSEAFVWLRLHVADLGGVVGASEPMWQTLRRRDRGDGLRRQPMSYEALRKVVVRANAVLGTNWSMHDLRHTAALRMSRDEHLSIRDVQVILGHAHLSTTTDVYLVEDEAQVIRRVQKHLGERERGSEHVSRVAVGYEAADLAVLFGEMPS